MLYLAATLGLICELGSEPGNDVDFGPALMRSAAEVYRADLSSIRKKKVLRVLTRNNSTSYYLQRGAEMGLEYELAKAFADELGVRLEMIVPEKRSGLIPALQQGRGDLIASGVTVTAFRSQDVVFAPSHLQDRRVLVVHAEAAGDFGRLEDLGKATVHVVEGSTVEGQLAALSTQIGAPIRTVHAPSDLEMEELIRQVGSKQIPATVADERIARLEVADGAPVATPLVLTEPVALAWATRKDQPRLAAELARFIAKHKKSGLLKMLRDRYLVPTSPVVVRRRLINQRQSQSPNDDALSPYDGAFRLAAQRYRLDWRLLAALAYHESRFNPRAVSRAGAMGLMQILPRTAAELGCKRPYNAAQSINAGASYLRQLMGALDGTIEERERIRMSLAAYNAGLGHITDARALARQLGLDANQWFGHVEKALRFLSMEQYHSRAAYGYARAAQTIRYVSDIQTSYDAYTQQFASTE